MQTEQYRGVDRFVEVKGREPIDQYEFLDHAAKHARTRKTVVGWMTNVPATGAMLLMAQVYFEYFMRLDKDLASKAARALIDLLKARASKGALLKIEPVPILDDEGGLKGYIVGVGTWRELSALVDFVNYNVGSHVTKPSASKSRAIEIKKAASPSIDPDQLADMVRTKANITSSAGSTYSVAPSSNGYGAESAMQVDALPRLPPIHTGALPGVPLPAAMPAMSNARAPPPPAAMPAVSNARAPPPPAAMPAVSNARAPPPPAVMPTVSNARAPPPPAVMPTVSTPV
jgi:hypothetical protein